MAPLSKEIRPISSIAPPHLGPAIPEVNTVWFKLFIYYLTGYGPPSILFSKGSRLKQLPRLFKSFEKILVTTWGHDPTVLPISNLIFTVNEALCHSAVLVQGFGESGLAKTVLVPFPMSNSNESGCDWSSHPAVKKLSEDIDLEHNCGFLTMVNLKKNNSHCYFKGVHNHFGSSNNVVDSWIENQLNNQNVPDLASPVNGITSQESADILEEELNTLLPVRPCESKESINANEISEIDFSKWTLLDCDFGIPLFNAKTNQQVCDAICKHKLWTKAR